MHHPGAIARDLTALRVDHHFQPTFRQERLSQPINRCHVHSDCIEVDELIFEIADYRSDYVDVAAEKLLRKCKTSWEAYQYLQDRVHDPSIPDSARVHLKNVVHEDPLYIL